MFSPDGRLPTCSLRALRFGRLPPELRRPLLREAARACADYVRCGGDLGRLDEDASCLRDGTLYLHPLPPPSAAGPRRADVEAGLRRLEASWSGLVFSERDRLRFLLGVCGHLAAVDPLWLSWSRIWTRRRERETARNAARVYREALALPDCRCGADGITGCWRGAVESSPEALARALHDWEAVPLKRGRRGEVRAGVLLGEEVVVKHFKPNPRPWRKVLGISRARRAWAGSRVLRELGIACPEALGVLEFPEGRGVGDSYVIHRLLPGQRTLRDWLRGSFPQMAPARRAQIRHQIRNQLLELMRSGCHHKDSKLHNLLVRERPGGILEMSWIDLEDIRVCGRVPFWRLIRNFVQLNGSAPRRLSRAERLAFVRGFRSRYPLADHPWVLGLIERKTRRRLQREVRRECAS